VGERDLLVENEKFGYRFFPPEMARSPAPVVMSANKDTNTYRIFLLGESAALGDPAPAFGAGRYLEVLLQERFPARRFEVICVAMTAINSHAILPIARECARHHGDCWIIYMGNNEMSGPFGATSVFGRPAPPLGWVRFNLALQCTRTGQLLQALGRKFRGSSSGHASWAGMKMFLNKQVPPEDPARKIVADNFEKNLEDILQAGRSSGTKMVLNTVAVNLKDCAPFASIANSNLPATDRATFEKLNRESIAAQTRGDFVTAAQDCESAAKLDPTFAELQFRWAQCLLRLTNDAAAAEHFSLARDFDALPFRTTSKINDLTASAARRVAGPGLVLFDAVKMTGGISPGGVAGEELFYEHAHFNFDGNYVMGRSWAGLVRTLLSPEAMIGEASEWPSQQACDKLLGLSDWSRAAVYENMLARLAEPPFNTQLDHAGREGLLNAQLAQVRAKLTPQAATETRAAYEDAIRKRPDDHWLHEQYADFLEANGDPSHAVSQWEAARDLTPHYHLAYYQIGRLLAAQGKTAEAQAPLLHALNLRPDLGAGWFELGKIHVTEGKPQLALQEFERSRKLVPENYHVYFHEGRALSKLQKRSDAIAMFRQAIERGPKNYWEAHYALGEELAFDGRTKEAAQEFAEVIRVRPEVAMAHLNLGVALTQFGKLDDALKEFEETLRLDPQNKLAPGYLAKVRIMKERRSQPNPPTQPAVTNTTPSPNKP
jgi:tetratricopeptide (TPR) repeat protein